MLLPGWNHVFYNEVILVKVNAFLDKIIVNLFKGSMIHSGILNFSFIKEILQKFEFPLK